MYIVKLYICCCMLFVYVSVQLHFKHTIIIIILNRYYGLQQVKIPWKYKNLYTITHTHIYIKSSTTNTHTLRIREYLIRNLCVSIWICIKVNMIMSRVKCLHVFVNVGLFIIHSHLVFTYFLLFLFRLYLKTIDNMSIWILYVKHEFTYKNRYTV